MIKEEKPIFFKVLLVVVIILIINIVVFTVKINYNASLTGLSISEKISTSYSNISSSSKIFLLIQWVILLTLLLGTYLKEKKMKKKPQQDDLSGIDVKKIADQDGTDLDTLYKILKEKKKLSLSSIIRLFKVKKEVAMNWCKTLESGNLATINYVSTKDPVIKIIEQENGR
jgi:hypothetical protein